MKTNVTIIDGPLGQADRADRRDFTAEAGAVVCFEGVVRPTEDGRAIAGLTYQTYDPMAQRQLQRLADEASERFDLLGVAARHSRGFVPAGGCSFHLCVAAAHRKAALAAMDWFIDQMKRDAPIWKSPVYAGDPTPRTQEAAT